jgi:hypothetical protein
MSTSVLVDFKVEFNVDEMPSSYSNPEYLEEVVKEAVEDAMNDIGNGEITDLNVWVDTEGS